MEFGTALIYFLSIVLQVVSWALTLYYAIISLFAFIPKKELPDVKNKVRYIVTSQIYVLLSIVQ